MESNSKKTSAFALIIGGLLVFSNYLLKDHTEKNYIPHITLIVCSATIVVLGIISLRNVNKEIKKKK